MNKNTFSYQIASNVDLEELVVDIYCNGEMIAVINQEDGIDNPVIELWPKTDNKNWELDLKAFIEACENALSRLKDFQVQRKKDD